MIRDSLAKFPRRPTIFFPNNEVMRVINSRDFINLYSDTINQLGLSGVALLTLRNSRVRQLNQIIRREVFHRKNTLELGESLMVTRNNYAWNLIDNYTYLANGDIIQCDAVGDQSNLGNFSFLDCQISGFGPTRERYSDYGKLVLNPYTHHYQPLTSKQRNELYRWVVPRYKHLMEPDRLNAIASDPFLHCLDSYYAYAFTVHKSQESQFHDFYLDLSDWEWYLSQHPEAALRWLYTAVTRATNRLFHIYGVDKNDLSLAV